MKKNLFACMCLCLCFSLGWAQVGVFNDDPQGALDINTYPTDNIQDTGFAHSNGQIIHGLVLPVVDDGNSDPDVFLASAVENPADNNNASTVRGTLIYDLECKGLRFINVSGNWSDCIQE